MATSTTQYDDISDVGPVNRVKRHPVPAPDFAGLFKVPTIPVEPLMLNLNQPPPYLDTSATQDDLWGNALGQAGGDLLSSLFNHRRRSASVEPHESASHTDEPIIDVHTDEITGGGHEAGFAHGGFAPDSMVGQTIKFGEQEPEVAINSEGNMQL